jgi:hypothetical protein
MLAPLLRLKPLTGGISKSNGHLCFLHAIIKFYNPQASASSENDE